MNRAVDRDSTCMFAATMPGKKGGGTREISYDGSRVAGLQPVGRYNGSNGSGCGKEKVPGKDRVSLD